jgi:hypothetical protein
MKSLVLIVVACSAFAFACSSQKPVNDPGPAQKAGAAVDEAAHDTKEGAKKAADKVGEATEKTGEKIQEKTED